MSAMDVSSIAPTVELTPSDSLSFTLVPAAAPQAVLTIRNLSETQSAAFKVKTTQPKRYLVRPNQGIIKSGEVAKVVVILQQKDCDELLRLDLHERRQSNDKFLVQSTIIEQEFEASLENKQSKEYADRLTELWSKQEKKGIFNKKLRCRFVEEGNDRSNESSTPSNQANVDKIKLGLLQRPVPGSDDQSGVDQGDSDKFINEAATLRKKYDELVTYTVNLKAQMDLADKNLETCNSELKRCKAELDRAKNQSAESGLRQRKGKTSSGDGDDTKESLSHEVVQEKSFGLFHLLVVGLVFFLIGRYAV